MIKKRTYSKLLQGLLNDVNKHTQKVELVNLMQQQVSDDTFTVIIPK
tara:strand:+ start:213 stop:353 length:141 start_codon:yes stop_codon:yes gene_type:complete